ncbi:OPT oligopeptide transporter [Penicillium cf. viridicatum]|uniref:OPT oligopeptide transporter n=1 Tax=Penicillium cf. viridicatum TaxID=2972119 RepID=A0A9W9JIE5_9EURO|nr:OPT oligopeptide transporter [Penicillium cf. viridicatum]
MDVLRIPIPNTVPDSGICSGRGPSAASTEKSGPQEIKAHTDLRAFINYQLYSKLDEDEFAKRVSATVDELARYIVDTHEHDPNFPPGAWDRMNDFLLNDAIFENPEQHEREIAEAKIEVSLLTSNSPYSEVRAVVEPHDDPDLPCGTIRVYVIGLAFVILVAFINQLFSAAERVLPDVGVTLFGVRHSLNPGPFNKKEHMLISIMANVSNTPPSSRYIIFTQWLDRYFGQPYASSFGYQILLALSTNFMGFGLAGLCRRFLVYPSFCIWPRSLVTIALNSSLYNEENHSVLGPFRTTYNVSRSKLFLIAFALMFVWFWFPDYIFSSLSTFNWIAWIAPKNFHLTAITGIHKGLGFNPIPTFDWNIVTHVLDPLIVPFHVTINTFFGVLLGGIVIIGMYWTNAYHTGYLPINTNSMFNHYGKSFNVSMILDNRGWLDETKYQAYSPVYLAASSLTMYFFSFAVYSALVSYAFLYHSRDISLGFKSLVQSFKRKEGGVFTDIHSKLMSTYREVPEWWYAMLNVFSIVLGVAAVAGWPTFTSVGVVFFGIFLAVIFVIPTGIIAATTGIEIGFNVLVEFIGGAWQPGNALAMNFFKCFGYVTTAHAIEFANDLKLAHYVKIPQRQTFWAQSIAAFVSAFVCTGVMNFQITKIPDMCQPNQPDRFTCPGVNTYFTAAVLFGSLGARKKFGANGTYTTLLSAFPIGLALPFVFQFIQKRLPRNHWFGRVHPVMFLAGGMHWSPYNIAYMWPAVLPAYLSMKFVRTRYLAFWAKYNYVLSAALSTAIAIAGVIIFFAISYNSVKLPWWGNDSESGCEASYCTRLKVPKGEYFGPRIGDYP